jgi:hypothetical protein
MSEAPVLVALGAMTTVPFRGMDAGSEPAGALQNRCIGGAWRFPTHDGSLGEMDGPKRLSDPAFEPTDEDLIGLSERAFAHVRDAHDASLRQLREDIATARREAMEWLRKKRPDLKAAR